MSKLLIHESPLQVLPSLAVAIGLNEAIVLQQVHYWLERSNNEIDGHRWVYNTVQQWQDQFPFWSLDTVRRTLVSLKEKGLLIGERLSESRFDKTMYYRIDYDNLAAFDDGILQSGGCKVQSSGGAKANRLNKAAETTQETTQETTSVADAFEVFWTAGLAKVGKKPAMQKFAAAIKKYRFDPLEFAQRLADDVKARIAAGQLGIDRLHPATYLNQERWNDEILPGDRQAENKHTNFGAQKYVGTPNNEVDWLDA